MMLKMNGDLLESGADIIVHQVNCKGVMGAGLAKQVRDRYPSTYSAYRNFCTAFGDDALGHVLFVDEKDGLIANLFGQLGFGRGIMQTDYAALRMGLDCIREAAEQKGQEQGRSYRVDIPYGLGCGLAGGNWNIVCQIIDEIFKDSTATCEIWAWHK